MFDESLARLRAHQNNIRRYRRLLRTKLTDIERAFIMRRLEEEQRALDTISGPTWPRSVKMPQRTLSRQEVSHV